MPIGVPSEFWRKVKTRNVFMRLCKQSIKPSIDWKKFHELDETGIFNNLDTAILSQQFRKIRFQRMGLCWVCGVNEPKRKKGKCIECSAKKKD